MFFIVVESLALGKVHMGENSVPSSFSPTHFFPKSTFCHFCSLFDAVFDVSNYSLPRSSMKNGRQSELR